MSHYQKDSFFDAKKLPALQGILESWITVQSDYQCAMNNEDHAWNYRERACVGFLAAAVWKCKEGNGVALEEWHTQKGPKSKPSNGQCRCDLYVYHGGREFFIEAKHMRSRATGNREKEMGYISTHLETAVRDAKRLQCESGQQKLGVLFIVPFYPPGKHPENFDEHISGWLEDVARIPHSAMAWLFHRPENIRPKRHETICPGIVILVHALGETKA